MPPRRELVFLVRMWSETPGPIGSWRGSIRDVSSGRTLYVTAAAEIADFITLRTHDVRPVERLEPSDDENEP